MTTTQLVLEYVKAVAWPAAFAVAAACGSSAFKVYVKNRYEDDDT